MHRLKIRTSKKEELVEITGEIENVIKRLEFKSGLLCLFVPHTTAAVTINENADFSVKRDVLKGLSSIGLEALSYEHAEGNSVSHIKSSLFGCSQNVIVENNRLVCGEEVRIDIRYCLSNDAPVGEYSFAAFMDSRPK